MISINDVAKRAGVAKSTVSKVLNNYSLVSDETRLKVEKAVKELGYVPNSVAISLSKKEFNRVGLIVDIRHNSQYVDEINMQYLTGAFEKAKEYHIEVVTFFSSQFDDMNYKQVTAYLKSQRINCLIIYNLSIENKNIYKIIEKQEFYCVLVDSCIINDKTSSVSIDHCCAQYDVAKKTLNENDYINRVLYIAGGEGGYITNQRLDAMKKLQEEYNFELLIRYGDFNEYKAREITIKNAKNINAIVCASDLMAIGAVFALTELDIYRPVCGFDGIRLMGYTKIAMNTVKQDFNQKSKRAFDELKTLLYGGKGQYVEIPYEVCKIDYMDVIQK
ncbi:LacI family DNA-binding transcriptional regulator [Candidatus Galacturonibacter soehngenii]|uniref:LacI family transcriptional regulator n=1 Tax=Candidatus Galacturonatibacter soehngenii TaxID=2307010 RepID=A0A7V7UBA2_9FIRM|nr:LacI family DNA-binding transcriptional regulator [Candidatus Galacturonibacter soehngenii]KAB1437898.1 LacI family transcriptional regulator [Candidatus Galacturonibacter soehngenii]MBA4687677.1 LacI family DNA-binding transcriptional regulator [Candidatus Galacturonibacter soehngenii]